MLANTIDTKDPHSNHQSEISNFRPSPTPSPTLSAQTKMEHNLDETTNSYFPFGHTRLDVMNHFSCDEGSKNDCATQRARSDDLIQFDRTQNNQPREDTSMKSTSSEKSKRARSLVSSSWNERFQELIHFREANDHCFVPHKYPPNPKLSQWVRKQRHQRKRKEKGLHSTLSDERQELLTNAGFIWDSHRAQWQERYQSLEVFHMTNGHCNVPSNFYDSSLSNWVKNQRKQYKLFNAGLMTAMDEERIELLTSLGFNWNPRGL